MAPSSGEVLDDFEELLKPPAWHADALCKEDPEIDFLARRRRRPVEALAICSRCLVRDECRQWALDRNDVYLDGVWGGTTPAERRAILLPTPAVRGGKRSTPALLEFVAQTPELTWAQRRVQWNLEHPERTFATDTGIAASFHAAVRRASAAEAA